ncbi:MAG: fibrobacter succinogenes major paralogous domain-containing protein [Prevotellaceae bacterium]|jgi:hypothetical protein|nr:fibrobacter succinogenes major paralogous domain-containing protein [Prevotellaceae bacterium]
MKTNNFLFSVLFAGLLSGTSFSAAQVTIGGSDLPKAGAIVDLNPQNGVKGGLALSSVSIIDLDKIPVGTNLFSGISVGVNDDVNIELTGAIVYNNYEGLQLAPQLAGVAKFGKGIYVWNGNQWNKIGKPEHAITFAPYNLGADPAYDTPKKQIEYLANCSTAEAVNVWGDLYQWGRIADGHEKRDAASYTTYGALSAPTDLDATTGQVIDNTGGYSKSATDQKYGHYIIGKDEDGTDNDNNWRTRKDDLWGNGVAIGTETSGKGVLYTLDGKYYQNTDWAISANNPCASMGAGWRVPTQDEWERLVNYDWNPSNYSGNNNTITITTTSTGQATTSSGSAPLTWVRVKGGKASDVGWGTSQGALGGYAVYKTDDWEAATGYNSGTEPLYEAAAPEPLFFFPAAGYRSTANGAVYTNGPGYYWSSTINSEKAFCLYFANDRVIVHYSYARAMGYSIRCVKE